MEVMDEELHHRNSFVQVCLSRNYGRCLMHPLSQTMVVLCFSILTVMAALGSSRIQVNFSLDYFINSDNLLSQYINLRSQYFPESGYRAGFFTTSHTDFLKEATQQEYLKVLNIFSHSQLEEQRKWTVSGSVSSWYRTFLSFVEKGGCATICGGSCKTGDVIKDTFMGECLGAFLDSTTGALLNNDVIRVTKDGPLVT